MEPFAMLSIDLFQQKMKVAKTVLPEEAAIFSVLPASKCEVLLQHGRKKNRIFVYPINIHEISFLKSKDV